MSLKIKIGFLVIAYLMLSCRENKSAEENQSWDKTSSLIEVSQLMSMNTGGIAIIDFRTEEEYKKGHLPGALNIWRNDLENKSYPYGGMRPTKKSLEQLIGSLGIENTDHIVVYDDKGSVDAARLWWLLNLYEFDQVKILNGGLSAWIAEGGRVDKNVPETNNSRFTLSHVSNSEILANKEQMTAWLHEAPSSFKIIDVRSKAEYSGQLQRDGAKRSGHIPGSIHIEWSGAIDTTISNKFRKQKELLELYEGNGILPNDTIVVYCQSGSRSSHTTFVLKELLNYKHVKNYDGSWTEWSYYKELPIEKDSVYFNLNE